MPVSKDEESNERIRPSTLAEAARDRWLKANPHYKERIREQLAPPARWTDQEIDAAIAKWMRITGAVPDDQRVKTTRVGRLAELRRARRRLRLAITVCCLAIGASLAVIVWYGILGNH